MIYIFFIVNLIAFLVGVFKNKPPKYITPKRIYEKITDFIKARKPG
jgi:hypothetical protein